MKCVLFDMDGTLCDPRYRLHYLKEKPKNWDAFFAAAADDPSYPDIIDLYKYMNRKYYTFLVSARPLKYKEQTLLWLSRYEIFPVKSYFRPDGDRREDSIVKSEILDQILQEGWSPWLIFDDRDRVVQMWRSRGFTCCQVNNGDF